MWGAEQQACFDLLQDKLCTTSVLRLPELDYEFIVDIDACNNPVGAVLFQETDGQLHPIEYFNSKHSPTEQNWPIIDNNFLAIYKAC